MSAPTSQSSSPSIQICRIMRPDDANIVGNVHGGTILKMIEEAGCIIGTRHCNTQTGDRCVAALARVERTDFLYPMFIGEVAHVSAEISFTSKHSVEVQVSVVSENILTVCYRVVMAHVGIAPFICLLCQRASMRNGSRHYVPLSCQLSFTLHPLAKATTTQATAPAYAEACALSG
ncbi:cytosolic acyl coenzyme A thioester hydrolase isoform X2 [Tachysurus ichikawai]